MKKPYLDQDQRQSVINESMLGALLLANIQMKKVAREIDKSLTPIFEYCFKKAL